MLAVSRDFAPPFRLIAPYFVAGGIAYLASMIAALFLPAVSLHVYDAAVLGWVHLFLLGFVMMTIFGAMAQLIPVVLEVGHFAVAFYYLIWPLLLVGTLLMALGFMFAPPLLPYGGVVVLIAMTIFLFDVFMTLRSVKQFNLSAATVVIANLFLLLGVVFGLLLALGYTGGIGIDIATLLKAHVFLVVGGYIMTTIMGLSMVLIPMFGLSHNFSQTPVKAALWMMGIAVISVTLSALTGSTMLEYAGYLLAIASLLTYGYQIIVLYRARARKEHDIYARSLYVAFGALLLSLLLGAFYLLSANPSILPAAGWTLFAGFFGFLITGHLYKIIPFLVWFERFSPRVGKEKVPMLADMLPQRSADAQLLFSAAGTALAAAGVLLRQNTLFHAGISFCVVGACYLLYVIFYIMRYK